MTVEEPKMTLEELNSWLMKNYHLKEKHNGCSVYSRGHRTVSVWDNGNIVVRFISSLEIIEKLTNIKMFSKHENLVYYIVPTGRGVGDMYCL